MTDQLPYDLVCLGLGPKTISVVVKAACHVRLTGQRLRIAAVERRCVCANWLPVGGLTDGVQLLGTRPEKDLVYPQSPSPALGGRALTRVAAEYSWHAYLIAIGAYSNWVDSGTPRPTHYEWAKYVHWALERAISEVPGLVEVFHRTVVRVAGVGDLWRVETRGLDGEAGVLAGAAFLYTGVGLPRTPFDASVMTAQCQAWTLESRELEGRSICLVGCGESASSLARDLILRSRGRAKVTMIGAKAFQERREGYSENALYSDSEAYGWSQLDLADRAGFIRQTDIGVCSPETYAFLTAAPVFSYIRGRAVSVERGEKKAPGLRVALADGGVHEADLVVDCSGFDVRGHLHQLFGPDVMEQLSAQEGPETSDDFALRGVHPRLFVPALASLDHGPGLANLSCLGTLSNRIVESVAAAAGSTQASGSRAA